MKTSFLAVGAMALSILPSQLTAQFIINTFAGGGPNHIAGTTVAIGYPERVVVDASGNKYFSTYTLNRVFKLDTNNTLIVVAGYGIADSSGDGGSAVNAGLYLPAGLALDNNNNLYIADSGNNRVRRVNLTTGLIFNFAGNGTAGYTGDGSAATGAELSNPIAVAVDSSTGNVYISDQDNNVIRKVSTSGTISTFAGTGTPGFGGDGSSALGAQFNNVNGIAIDPIGNNLFVADSENNRIRRISLAGSNIIQTVVNQAPGTAGFSGDGTSAFNAQLNFPSDVFVDKQGNLFIADEDNGRIRRVSITAGVVGNITTVAGSANLTGTPTGDGGPATNASLKFPDGICVDSNGNLFIADTLNGRLRTVSSTNNFISTIAGNGATVPTYGGDAGQAGDAILNQPYAEAVDSQGNVYIADTFNNVVRKVDTTGIITTIAGTGTQGDTGDGGAATSAQLTYPTGVAIDSNGIIYIADFGNNKIRRIVNGIISTYVGTGVSGYGGDGGPAALAKLAQPYGISIDGSNNLYIADTGNQIIRLVSSTSQIITTAVGTPQVAGNPTQPNGDGGPPAGPNARLNSPRGVAVNTNGTVMYIADQGDNKIRWVSNSILNTYAGTGTGGFADGVAANQGELFIPSGVTLDRQDNLYIADFGNNRVRLVTGDNPNNVISTVAGSPTRGFGGDGGPATAALLASPFSLAEDATGRVYIGDISNNRVRILSAPCSYKLNSNSLTVGAAGGGPLSVGVIVGTGCPWTVSVPAGTNWVTIDSGQGATGPGNATFSVTPNTTGSVRNTTLTIAGQPFALTELAPLPPGPPFGFFDTPAGSTSNGNGSVGFTGWAVSPEGVTSVDIWRELGSALVYIGAATQVTGARPDIQQAFPNYPGSDSAGWGYLLLTNELPSNNGFTGVGNGTYRIHAIAHDAAGNSTDLGVKTLIVDNKDAISPFGAIDTPTQGGVASGTVVNFGWALTPLPATIPKDGSTITVYIDNVAVGHPTYNQPRGDIEALFPGLNNTNGAVGFLYIDTTKYANGLHTISWFVSDNAGNSSGLGSRYFNVQN